MKLFAILFGLALTVSAAQASTYLCPDGSTVQFASDAPYISMTVDGGAVVCEFSRGNPSPNTCSVSSSPSCAGAKIGQQCRDQFGQNGNCGQDLRTNKVGSDGNTICGCGVGE